MVKKIKNKFHPFKSIYKFIKGEKNEFKHIKWSSFKETSKKFLIVCLFVGFMGIFYTGVDAIISFVLKVIGGVI